MKNQKKFYDFDKGYISSVKPTISKNLLNARYGNISSVKKNSKNMYLHAMHKTDTYYEELYKDNATSPKEHEYQFDTRLTNLSYSEKIQKWKDMID